MHTHIKIYMKLLIAIQDISSVFAINQVNISVRH